jgi:hypothetical protein
MKLAFLFMLAAKSKALGRKNVPVRIAVRRQRCRLAVALRHRQRFDDWN